MHDVLRSIRVGARSLRRTPGFTIAAILTLALGIGLSTAVFTVADALILRPLAVHEQGRLVVLWGRAAGRGLDHFPLTLDAAREFTATSRALEQAALLAYEGARPRPTREGDQISRIRQALVSGTFFDVLGTRPVLGRTLRTDDDVLGAAPVVVLSHTAWQQRFGGRPDVLGQRLVMHDDGKSYTIVGVMPQGLDFPRGTDIWAPLIPARTTAEGAAPNAHVDVLGRLAPGAAAEGARAELTAWFARDGAAPFERELHGIVHPLPELILGDTGPALLAFAAASTLLLLITCINVANLLLVRGLARVREVAVRSALGASRSRLVTMLLTESGLLAVAGGLLGALVAGWGVETFLAFAPPGTPRIDEVALDTTVLTGAMAITFVALLIFALMPAIATAGVEVQSVLRAGARHGASRRSRLAMEMLVAGQVALAVMVLAAAGVVARSLIELERAELAIEPAGLLIVELAVRTDRFDDRSKQLATLDAVTSSVAAVPGVRAVSPVVAIPFAGTGGWDGRPTAEGQSEDEALRNPMLNMEIVSPDYFETLGLPIMRGRGFSASDRDGAMPVVVLSESAARHYWPDGDPLGERLIMGPPSGPTFTVVGIVPDTRYRDLRDARSSIYFPLQQTIFPFAPANLAVRTSGTRGELVPDIRRAIADADPGVALANAAPFETFLARPLAQPRLNTLLLAVFAAAAAALAAVGLFGVMAAMVRLRTRELGVRMALGATGAVLQRMVLRRGLRIAAVGTALGLVGALLVNRLLAAMLYGVSPTDGATLTAVAALLMLVAAVASAVPARATTRIDPVTALKADA